MQFGLHHQIALSFLLMQKLHPSCVTTSKAPSSSSAVTSSPTTPQYHTDESEVLQAIRSFPNGSGGGLDGLKPQHLKDLVGSRGREHESRLLKSLTHFVNLVLDGCVPQEIRSIFFGASLCALRKKDGGVRPIAIGNTLRRLISKVAVRGCAETCSNLLRPNQLGFGVRLGAEAAVHATRSFIESHGDNTVVLKIDFANAFNSIRRDKVLESANEHLPSLFKYVHSSYIRSIVPPRLWRPSSPLRRRGPAGRPFGSSSVLPCNPYHRETSLFSTQFVVPRRWDLGGFSFSSAGRLRANSVRRNPHRFASQCWKV